MLKILWPRQRWQKEAKAGGHVIAQRVLLCLDTWVVVHLHTNVVAWAWMAEHETKGRVVTLPMEPRERSLITLRNEVSKQAEVYVEVGYASAGIVGE